MLPASLRIFVAMLAATGGVALSGCIGPSSEPFSPAPKPTAGFPNIGYATWSDDEPDYRFYPGDQIELRVPSAPELNKTLVVQPDGRVSAPLVGPIMVADRSTQQVEDSLSQAYASQLIHPQVEVSLTAATPLNRKKKRKPYWNRIGMAGPSSRPARLGEDMDRDSARRVLQCRISRQPAPPAPTPP